MLEMRLAMQGDKRERIKVTGNKKDKMIKI